MRGWSGLLLFGDYIIVHRPLFPNPISTPNFLSARHFRLPQFPQVPLVMDLQNSGDLALTRLERLEMAKICRRFDRLRSFGSFGANPGPLQGRDWARLSEACPEGRPFCNLLRWSCLRPLYVGMASRNHWSTVSANTPNIRCAITFPGPRTRRWFAPNSSFSLAFTRSLIVRSR